MSRTTAKPKLYSRPTGQAIDQQVGCRKSDELWQPISFEFDSFIEVEIPAEACDGILESEAVAERGNDNA